MQQTNTPAAAGLLAIPAYNEEASLGRTLDELAGFWPPSRTFVVDDGSVDATAAVARAHGVRCITHPTNLGYGSALQTAIIFAAREGSPYLALMDADGQHDPRALERLLAPIRLDDADLVVGSRFVRGQPLKATLGRRIAMRVFSLLSAPVLGGRVRDTSSGFKAIHGRLFAELERAHFVDFHAEVLVYLALRRYRILELEVTMREREQGASMHGLTSAFTYPAKTILAVVVGAVEALRERPREAESRRS